MRLNSLTLVVKVEMEIQRIDEGTSLLRELLRPKLILTTEPKPEFDLIKGIQELHKS
jgi:hypothetical protein